MSHDISVVIPARNAEETLRAAVESALAQTLPPHEIIVVDDRSSDGTAEVARRFGTCVKLLPGSGVGPAAARNVGIRSSRGPLVAFLDADDIWLPSALASMLHAYRTTPGTGLVFADGLIEGRGGDLHPSWFAGKRLVAGSHVYDRLLRECFILTSATLVPRSVLREVGVFDEAPDCLGGEDWDLWLRIARRYPLTVVRDPLVRRRIMDSNLSSDHRAAVRARVYVLRKNAAMDTVGPLAPPGLISRELAAWLARQGRWQFEDGDFELAVRSLSEADRLAPLRRGLRVVRMIASLPAPFARAGRSLARCRRRPWRSSSSCV